MGNAFVLSPEAYGRDMNISESYMKDATLYLSIQTGQNPEVCAEYIRTKLTDGTFNTRDPEVLMNERNQHGDREQKVSTFNTYVEEVREKRGLMAPTMAVYDHPEKRVSALSEWIEGNIDRRKTVKHQMFEYKMSGNIQARDDANRLQSTLKTLNNSLSGAQVSPYTPLYNKTAHSALTSTCRTATGYANSNNERFLAGNRHYYTPEIAMENIVSIMRNTDYGQLKRCVDHYNLHIPTVQEVMDGIKRSTELYWENKDWEAKTLDFLTKCSPLQRTAYHYTSCFYNLRECNEGLVRTFLDRISKVYDVEVTNIDGILNSMDSDLKAFISVVCAEQLNGGKISDLKEAGKEYELRLVAGTVQEIQRAFGDYALLIRSLWTTFNPPSSVAAFTHSIRRVVAVSDTDSTIFTLQDWIIWFEGYLSFKPKAIALVAALTYLVSMVTIHLLAQLSGQMGVVKERIHMLSMKNEFMFPIVITTARAKHYASYISVCEGNVYPEYDFELKGVALKDSKLPKEVRDKLNDFIKDSMDIVIAEKPISLQWAMDTVAELEFDIYDSVKSGKVEYLSQQRINPMTAYKKPLAAVYLYHELWNYVFAEKYGTAPEPTYQAVKVSVDADNPTRLKRWLDNIQDEGIRTRFQKFCEEYGRKNFKHIMIPFEIVRSNGIPDEIMIGVDIRKITFTITSGFYLIMESLYCHMKCPNISRLISDEYEVRPSIAKRTTKEAPITIDQESLESA